MQPGAHLWVALVHHPVLDRNGSVVTTSVTNLDVHDLARSARTYRAAGLIVITPIEAQKRIVERIVGYWNEPEHAARIPSRRDALALVRTAASIEEARRIAGHGGPVELIGTSARPGRDRRTAGQARGAIHAAPGASRLILLGTGWGLAPEALEACDVILAPVEELSDYNHMSVRSAGAVILDRILGSEGTEVIGT
ncbi:MAG: RNA methyltransferase [Deltaproteobacteria bacterium]|nr:RNA methyltransferase [Deltaproteobacteria bacterium]